MTGRAGPGPFTNRPPPIPGGIVEAVAIADATACLVVDEGGLADDL
jgi:hypothetical protein